MKNPEEGGLPYEEYTGLCHILGSYFQGKIPKRVCQFFTKIPERGYNIWKKFQIGSVILMAQITVQKKTKLIDYFDLVWTKNPQFYENFWKIEAIFPQKALKIVFWRPPIGTKIPKMVLLFRQKFQKEPMWRP